MNAKQKAGSSLDVWPALLRLALFDANNPLCSFVSLPHLSSFESLFCLKLQYLSNSCRVGRCKRAIYHIPPNFVGGRPKHQSLAAPPVLFQASLPCGTRCTHRHSLPAFACLHHFPAPLPLAPQHSGRCSLDRFPVVAASSSIAPSSSCIPFPACSLLLAWPLLSPLAACSRLNASPSPPYGSYHLSITS